MDEILRSLLDALDVVGQTNEEIYDTVCRERMGDPIFYLFIKPTPDYTIPDDFGLYDTAANAAVKDALATYAIDANTRAAELGLRSFHQRLAAFQNGDVESSNEHNYFDDFFGWMNPENFDEFGNVIENR